MRIPNSCMSITPVANARYKTLQIDSAVREAYPTESLSTARHPVYKHQSLIKWL